MGLRIGELLALRWKHIDTSVAVIRVQETVHEGSFGTPKTRSSRRDIPISRFASELLQGLNTNASQDDLEFTSRSGAPVNPKNLANRVLRPACRALDLPIVGWHSFRPYSRSAPGRVGRFDQNCSGASRPLGCRNNTQHLHARNSRLAACCG
jgi:integrase